MNIQFTNQFGRMYKKLSPSHQRDTDEILQELQDMQDWSAYDNHPLKGSFEGFYSISIDADLRAIYKKVKGVAYFVAIGTHKELYN